MKPELFNRIVDFLWPHMDEAGRKALITPAFLNYSALYSKIDWGGASHDFTVRIVEQLSRYGEIEPGEQALARLIEMVRAVVGIENQREADALLKALHPARSIEDLVREQKENPKPQGPTRGGDGIVSKGGDTIHIHTGGGAYIDGDVAVGGDFSGRDQSGVGLESTRNMPDQAESAMQPTELRLDTAVPDKVEYQHTFPVAVAVRQPESEKLTKDDLPDVHSGAAQIFWPAGASSVNLRLEISAPDCEIEGTNRHSFQLFQDHDSPIFYFWLKSKKSGQIGIIVNLYQDENVLGSALAKTTVQTETVGTVALQLESEVVPKPNFPQRDTTEDLLRGKFESFQDKMKLVTNLLACPAVRNRNTRDTIVDYLPTDIRSRIERSNIDHIDVMGIVSRALDYPDGLSNFLEVIRFYEGKSVHMGKIDALVGISY